MTESQLWRCYDIYLAKMCSQISKIGEYKKMLDSNIEFSNEAFENDRRTLANLSKKFLKYKELLGLTGGLDFLSDCKFDGFSIKNGEFIGETTNVRLITDPYIEGYSHDKGTNYYLYEVANYVQYMAFPVKISSVEEDCKEEAYPTCTKKGGKRIWNLIKSAIRSWSSDVAVLEDTF